jgi:hypothetical protein
MNMGLRVGLAPLTWWGYILVAVGQLVTFNAPVVIPRYQAQQTAERMYVRAALRSMNIIQVIVVVILCVKSVVVLEIRIT